MSKFVQEIVTRKVLKVIDGDGPCSIYMSVVPHTGGDVIDLVVGARYADACCSTLNKKGLGDLIEELKLIHRAM